MSSSVSRVLMMVMICVVVRVSHRVLCCVRFLMLFLLFISFAVRMFRFRYMLLLVVCSMVVMVVLIRVIMLSGV